MQPQELIDPLPPPACPRCGTPMVIATDRVSGRPVRTGGDALMRCPACGDLEISFDPIRDRRGVRRYNLIVRLAFVAGLLMSLSAEALGLLMRIGAGPSAWLPLILGLMITAMLCMTLHALGFAIQPRSAESLVERWFVFAFWLAAFVGTAALSTVVARDVWRDRARLATPAGTPRDAAATPSAPPPPRTP